MHKIKSEKRTDAVVIMHLYILKRSNIHAAVVKALYKRLFFQRHDAYQRYGEKHHIDVESTFITLIRRCLKICSRHISMFLSAFFTK